ncbi:MAG TPA: OmpH family outer membrane protein [Sphingomonas sp.]|nr:OmpH family outer membrane protein [Sphingomonas sp.]
MTTRKHVLAAMIAAPVAFAFAAPANAQVGGIASANYVRVVASTKAFGAAEQQIATTYKAAFEQLAQRRQALETEMKPLRDQLDTNKDGQVSDAELQSAQTAKSPTLQKIQTAQTNAQNDMVRLGNPAARAELFAIESILQRYEAAQLAVVNARKINVVLSPEAFIYAPDSVDISQAIAAEIDKASPTVSIQPPANWQPARETLAIQQQIAQIRSYQAAAAQQRAAQGQQAGAPPTQPAKPAEPR